MAASTRSRSMLRVTGSISTNTGRAPTSRITLLVATHESGVVITSWPGPTPAMRSAISIVQVPELKARTGRLPKYSDSFDSKSLTFGPEVIHPERSTSATPAMVSSSMLGRVKGKKGFMTGPPWQSLHSSLAAHHDRVAIRTDDAAEQALARQHRPVFGLHERDRI